MFLRSPISIYGAEAGTRTPTPEGTAASKRSLAIF